MEDFGNSGKISFENTAFMPKEEHLETAVKNRRISIGIPCRQAGNEKRVALTPESVNLLVENENEVIIQKGAGLAANYTDKDYSENGAIISDSPAMVYSADAVIKVSPFTEKETEYLKGNQAILSSSECILSSARKFSVILSGKKLRPLLSKRSATITERCLLLNR